MVFSIIASLEAKYLEIGIMIMLFISFVINPLFGILVTLFLTWLFNSWHFSRFTTILLSVFLWCLESTRNFSMYEKGDFPGYLSMFQDIGKVPILELIFSPSSAKLPDSIEYGWLVLNKIGYLLFNGDFFHFVYFMIAVSYLLVFSALYIYTKNIKANYRFYLCSISFIAFLSSYFKMNNNILSQQMAMSVVIFALIEKIVKNKLKWYLVLLAVFLHNMCIAFLPLFFIKLDKRPTIKYICYGICFFFFLFFFMQRLDMLTIINISFVQKLAYASSYGGVDVMDTAAAIFFLLIVAIMYVIIVWYQNNVHPNTISLINILMIIALICVATEPLPLIQIRYYMTRLLFLAFLIPYLFNKNYFISDCYTLCIMCIFIISFFLSDFEDFNFTFSSLFEKSIFDYNII